MKQTNCHSATKLTACTLKEHFLQLYKTRISLGNVDAFFYAFAIKF